METNVVREHAIGNGWLTNGKKMFWPLKGTPYVTELSLISYDPPTTAHVYRVRIKSTFSKGNLYEGDVLARDIRRGAKLAESFALSVIESWAKQIQTGATCEENPQV